MPKKKKKKNSHLVWFSSFSHWTLKVDQTANYITLLCQMFGLVGIAPTKHWSKKKKEVSLIVQERTWNSIPKFRRFVHHKNKQWTGILKKTGSCKNCLLICFVGRYRVERRCRQILHGQRICGYTQEQWIYFKLFGEKIGRLTDSHVLVKTRKVLTLK